MATDASKMPSYSLSRAVRPELQFSFRKTQINKKSPLADESDDTLVLHVETQTLWPTPTKHNAKQGGYPAEHRRNSPTLGAKAGGRLNPDWVEWLMGWPCGWTDLEPLTNFVIDSWEDDPADDGRVSRVTTVSKHRTVRLQCTGNGQVPQCAAAAWVMLFNRVGGGS